MLPGASPARDGAGSCRRRPSPLTGLAGFLPPERGRGRPGRGAASVGAAGEGAGECWALAAALPSVLLFLPVPSIVPSAGWPHLGRDTAPPQVPLPTGAPSLGWGLWDSAGGRSIGAAVAQG